MAGRFKQHLDNYQPTQDGDFEYCGLVWTWDKPELRATSIRFGLIMLAVSGVSVIAAGCFPLPGGYAVYTLIPYAATIVCVALSMLYFGRLMRESNPIRDHIYTASIVRLKPCLIVGSVFALISALGAVIQLVRELSSGSPMLFFGLYLLLMFVCAVCLFILRRHLNLLTFTCETKTFQKRAS